MLVLSRRVDEEIVIAGDIRVKVLAVKGNQVRVGITAPRSVIVKRQELVANCSEGAVSSKVERDRENDNGLSTYSEQGRAP